MKAKNGLMRLLIAGEIIILILVLALGMVRKAKGQKAPEDHTPVMQNKGNRIESAAFAPGGPRPEETAETTEQDNPSGEDEQGQQAEETPPPEGEAAREIFPEEIEALLATMTIEQKVAQIFMVTPETLTGTDQVTIAGNGTKTALQTYPVGGILYGTGNFVGVPQMKELIGNAQAMSVELSGQNLFAGTLLEREGGTVVAVARSGQEEQLGALLNPQATPEESAIAEFIQFPLYGSVEQLSTEQAETRVKCFLVGENGAGAVEALQNGTDMLCVTSGFTEVYQRVITAVNAQEIPGMVLDEAVGHVLVEKQTISGQAGNDGP